MNYLPLLFFLFLPLILVVQIYFIGVRMSKPENMMRPMPEGMSPQQQEIFSYYSQWLSSVGLQFYKAFQFGTIQVAVFQQGNMPRFFSFLFHKRVTFSAESYMTDLTVLDTSNSGSLGLFPRPGAYAQSFPNMPAEELWQRHLEGEAELTKKFGYQWSPLNRPYEEVLADAMRVRMQYNRSQFLWPVRVLYRFFVTRFQIANRTIAQQFP